jgi:hypothetical protein
MSEQSPESQGGSDRAIMTVCAILGAVVFVVLNLVTNGKVPGGAIGGAIGGVLGGLVGLGINSLRKK